MRYFLVQGKEKNLWSNNGEGSKVKYLRAYDGKHEIQLVLDEIKRLNNKLLIKKKNNDINFINIFFSILIHKLAFKVPYNITWLKFSLFHHLPPSFILVKSILSQNALYIYIIYIWR